MINIESIDEEQDESYNQEEIPSYRVNNKVNILNVIPELTSE